jgi:hypothetical protein
LDPASLAIYEAVVPVIVSALEQFLPRSTIRALIGDASQATTTLTAFYTSVFGAAPTPAQLADFQTQLANGTFIQGVETEILAVTPTATAINNLYKEVLGRDANTTELASDFQQVYYGTSLASIRASLAQSNEAANDLSAIYQQVLGGAIDPATLATYQQQLATNTSLAQVRTALATSPQVTAVLTSVYEAVYGGAAPSQNVITFLEAELAKVTGPGGTGTTVQAVATSLFDPLVIDTVAHQRIDLASTDQPFAAVSVSDPVPGSETATLTLTSRAGLPDGVLSGGGVSATSVGVYTVTAPSAAALTTALQSVVYTPTSTTHATTKISLSIQDALGDVGTAATTTVTAANLGLPAAATFVYASVGNDTFTGTAISGGTPEAFVFNLSAIGTDVINNFNYLKDFLYFSTNTFGSVSAVLAATQNQSGNAVISLGGTSTVTLTGISPTTLLNHSQDIKLI